MLTREEQQYLIWLTATLWQGWGAVVDLGPWIGCSSAALAEGMRRSGKEGVVHSYDLFVWRPDYMEQYLATGLADGADFQHVFAEQTAAYADRIRAERMDLLAGKWSGGPIEILFVDAAKTWALTNSILRTFSPSLVPGKSLVVLQDFKHMPTYWLPLVFGQRPDLWEEMHDLAEGDTTVFRLRAALDVSSGPQADYSRQSFSAAEVQRIFSDRWNRPGRLRIALSYYRALLAYGLDSEAEALLAEASAGTDENGRRRLEEGAQAAREGWCGEVIPDVWKALTDGDVDRAEDLLRPHDAPRDPYYNAALGRIAQIRGDHAKAIAAFEKSLSQQSKKEPSTILFAASSRITIGEFDAAHGAILDVLLDKRIHKGTRSWGLSLLRECWQGWRDFPAARAALLKLLAADARDPDLLVLAALVDLKDGDVDAARNDFRAALEVAPAHAEARAQLDKL